MSNPFATPFPVAHQAPLSMEFPGQEYWSGLPFPEPLPEPGRSKPESPGGFFIAEPLGRPIYFIYSNVYMSIIIFQFIPRSLYSLVIISLFGRSYFELQRMFSEGVTESSESLLHSASSSVGHRGERKC